MKLLYLVNGDKFFLSHRLDLAMEARKRGFMVEVATMDTGLAGRIRDLGFPYHEIYFDRSGTNLFKELICLINIIKLYRRVKPDIVHHLTIKPVLYGTIAARILVRKRIKIINAITGLGYTFFNESNNQFFRKFIIILYRLVFNSSKIIGLFQNPDDMELFKVLRILPDNSCKLIKGSGVDLNEYYFSELPDRDIIKVLFSGRLLYDKGIVDFIEASRIVQQQLKAKVVFIVAGEIDSGNPSAVKREILIEAEKNGLIEWLGYQEHIIPILIDSDIVVLPSYYGEGLPKALIEACAIGRPIITTDSPGCRETVEEGINGFLVEKKSPQQISAGIIKLAGNYRLRKEFGIESRKIAEREFALENVIERTLSLYNS